MQRAFSASFIRRQGLLQQRKTQINEALGLVMEEVTTLEPLWRASGVDGDRLGTAGEPDWGPKIEANFAGCKACASAPSSPS